MITALDAQVAIAQAMQKVADEVRAECEAVAKAEIAQLRHSLSASMRTEHDLRSLVNRRDEQIEYLKSELKSANDELRKLKAERDQLKLQIVQMRVFSDGDGQNISELHAERDALRDELTKVKAERDELKRQIDAVIIAIGT